MATHAALGDSTQSRHSNRKPAANLGRFGGWRWRAAAFVAAGYLLLNTLPARAQGTPPQDQMVPSTQGIGCLPAGQTLLKIPEFISSNGVLRGTILLADEQQRLAFRSPPGFGNVPGKPGLYEVCQPQYVRYFQGLGATPVVPPGPGPYPDPVPGPTLRARVGDVVELTFLNQINPGDFGDSIDRAENGPGGCDESSAGYPGNDAFPDCFHGSSTGNIHFHGTHTNPNATGDDVFIEVRPSPRVNNQPTVTAESVKAPFDKFFAECEARLKTNPVMEWPMTWNDPPLGPPADSSTWTAQQRQLLQAYDSGRPAPQQLWPVDEQQLKAGYWPQYYIGAFPYCFRLPEYTARVWPPAPSPAQGARMEGMGISQPAAALQMGQSPGTHWYHAHKHGSTTINVSNGMTGAFIVEGKYDDDLNSFYGEGWSRRQPVIVINQLGVTPNKERGTPTDKGEDFSVNGRLHPVLSMRPGEVQLWRIVNTSSRSGAFFIGPPAGFEWKQLAQDGVQFADVNYQKSHNASFLMMAGNRVDLLVKAPMQPQSAPAGVMVQPAVSKGDLHPPPPALPLFAVEVSGTGPEMQFIKRAPAFPPFLADISDDEIKGTKNIVFNSNPPGSPQQHTIDGKQFDGEVGEVVLLNRVEEWKVENTTVFTPIDHPFHIHINPFQVTEVFDPNETLPGPNNTTIFKYVFGPPESTAQCQLDPNNKESWKPCSSNTNADRIWWDVFPIPSGRNISVGGKNVVVPGYFKLRSRFVDFPGLFVLHCHILAHEDRGMMTVVDVRPLASPYAHQ